MNKKIINYVVSLCYLAELLRSDLISEEEYYMMKKNLSLKYEF